MNYTKGRWEIIRPYIDKPITIESRIRSNLFEMVATISQMPKNDVQLANAHLISAAPDMYEALLAVVTDLQEYLFPDVLNQVKQAITKAEGK